MKAMKEELGMIVKNKKWELDDCPKERDVIGVKWIYKTKLNSNRSIQKHKARLVARGFTQKPGADFFETFASVSGLETIKTNFLLIDNRNFID